MWHSQYGFVVIQSKVGFMILKVFSNLNDSIILLLFARKESLKMHSFYKNPFAAQDMCGFQPVGINVGAQEDLCLGQGGLQGQRELRRELSTQGCSRAWNSTATTGCCSPLTTHLQILSLWVVLYPKAHSLPKAQWFRAHWRQLRHPHFSPKSLPDSVIISSAHKFHISIWRERKHIQILRLFLALPGC